MSDIAQRIAEDQKARAEKQKQYEAQAKLRAEEDEITRDQRVAQSLIDQVNGVIEQEYNNGKREIGFKLPTGSTTARTTALKTICKQYLAAEATVYATYYNDKFEEQVEFEVKPDFYSFPKGNKGYYDITDFIIKFKYA